MTKRIGYVGGFWATNIGNAFYDLGVERFLKSNYSDADIFFIPDAYFHYYKTKNAFDYIGSLDLDLIIFGGPILGSVLAKYEDIFMHLIAKNTKLAFISAGMQRYTEGNYVLSFLDNYKDHIQFIATRDRQTYDLLRSTDVPILSSICCSFNLKNFQSEFAPITLEDKLTIFSFMKFVSINVNENFDISKSYRFPVKYQKSFKDTKVVHLNHGTFDQLGPVHFANPTYYSDLPYGYLSIYKEADYVFSDRVHSCAAGLIFGAKARYFSTTRRSEDGRYELLRQVCSGDIFSEAVYLDSEYVDAQLENLNEFVGDLIRD